MTVPIRFWRWWITPRRQSPPRFCWRAPVTSTGAAIVPGASAVYAAVPTASVAADTSGNPIYGAVYEAIFATGSTIPVSVQGARYLSMDHDANNLLVFGQNSDTVTLVNNTGGALTSTTGTLTSTLVNGVRQLHRQLVFTSGGSRLQRR